MGNQIYWLAAMIVNGFIYLKAENETIEIVGVLAMIVCLVIICIQSEREVDRL